MRRLVWSLTAIGLLAGQAYSAAPRQQPPAVPTDQALEAYRMIFKGLGLAHQLSMSSHIPLIY